jgi:hypothetical protein
MVLEQAFLTCKLQGHLILQGHVLSASLDEPVEGIDRVRKLREGGEFSYLSLAIWPTAEVSRPEAVFEYLLHREEVTMNNLQRECFLLKSSCEVMDC